MRPSLEYFVGFGEATTEVLLDLLTHCYTRIQSIVIPFRRYPLGLHTSVVPDAPHPLIGGPYPTLPLVVGSGDHRTWSVCGEASRSYGIQEKMALGWNMATSF